MKYLKIKDSVDLNVLIDKYGFQSRTIHEYGRPVKQLVFKGLDSPRDVILVVDANEKPEVAYNYRIIKYVMKTTYYHRPIPAVLLQMATDGILEEINLDQNGYKIMEEK